MKTNAPIGRGARMQTALKGTGSAKRGAPVHADANKPCAFKSRLFTILSPPRPGGRSQPGADVGGMKLACRAFPRRMEVVVDATRTKAD